MHLVLILSTMASKTQYQHSVSVLKHNILDNIMNVCRVCMKVRKNMRNLFRSVNKLVEKIHFCTGIHISKTARLSSSICQNCESELTTAHKFKKKILNAYTFEVYKTLSGDDKCLAKVDKTVKNELSIAIKSVIEDTILLSSDEIDINDVSIGNVKIKNMINDVDDTINDDNALIEDSNDMIKDNDDAESLLIFEKDKVTEKRNKEHSMDGHTTNVLRATRNCMYCDQIFRTKFQLAAHKRECHKEQSHICDICGQTLKNLSSFNSHKRLHSAPQFSCGYCDYKTHTKNTLTNHMTLHNGERKFICSYCSARFRLSTNLRSHVKIMHLKQKTHFCTQCDASFFGSTKLKRHLDSHDNIKRYECEVCHSCFTRRCHWKIHLLKQHNVTTPPVKRGRQKTLVVAESSIREP